MTIPQLEYQELKAQSRLLDMTEDPTEQSIVKLQIQLVQTTEVSKMLLTYIHIPLIVLGRLLEHVSKILQNSHFLSIIVKSASF